MNSFSYLEPVCCSMSSSNCCFLTCIEISQEAGQVFWYSHLFQNFPQFIVMHTVKGFGIVNKAEIDAFLELSCFFDDPVDVGNLISGVGDGQGGLACCDSWGCKESDTTERLIWSDLNLLSLTHFLSQLSFSTSPCTWLGVTSSSNSMSKSFSPSAHHHL